MDYRCIVSDDMDIGGVLRIASRLFVHRLVPIATVLLLVAVAESIWFYGQSAWIPGVPGEDLWATLLDAIVPLVLSGLMFLSLMVIIAKTIDNSYTDWFAVWGVVWARLPAYIGTSLMLTVFIFGLSLLLIVPAIIFGVFWLFCLHAVALRKRDFLAALSYSKEIVSGRWWLMLGYIVLTMISAAVIIWLGAALSFIPTLLLSMFAFMQPLLGLIYVFAIYLLMSFIAVVWTVLFLNLDIRKGPAAKIGETRAILE
ncbi:MAG: hypothetical protein FH749_13720 [Firmicutes bacterium]|nr:hypothetical protein [Bacillota bacterium]